MILLISNNPMVNKNKSEKNNIIFDNSYTYLDILTIARDKIHVGHTLLTHPLSSSLKPNETPYKTVLVSNEVKELDIRSLEIIEDSIKTYQKFINNKKTPGWAPTILSDFMLIDFDIVKDYI